MPWSTPSLRQTREMVRDEITSSLHGAAFIGNNVLRVMADAMAGLTHLVLRFIDWLSLQLLPDTAETEWLDRHGDIWLVNANGTTGRKLATYAEGVVTLTGAAGSPVPAGTRLETSTVGYETLLEIVLGTVPTEASVRALDPGAAGNLDPGVELGLVAAPPGVDGSATVVLLGGGTDVESDSELRMRVLLRIRNPPMGGDAMDYVLWMLAVPGVTRAWCSPLEQGMGTVTGRFMMDNLRADRDGFPLGEDIDRVKAYVDSQRPVAVKDIFILSPIPEPIDFTIAELVPDDSTTRSAITVNVNDMIMARAAPAWSQDGVAQPAQTIFAAWVSEAISETVGVRSFRLIMDDHVMPTAGSLAVLGTISYAP